jgi:prepilin-type N-terminal cleavage/methylation domain-containing protein
MIVAHKHISQKNPQRHGFTLIELLVVIGLIAVLAAGIGISMREGNPSAPLRAGQNILVGLLSGARGQAALNQSDAMIIINATPGDSCLREMQVVVRVGTDTWRAVGAPTHLPQGIYIVPPAEVGGVQFTGSWSNERKSTGFITTPAGTTTTSPEAVAPADTANDPFKDKVYLKFQIFSALGKTTGSGRLLVTSGKQTGPSAVSLDNPELIRGVTVSRYGVPTFINEAETFDQIQ